MAKENQYGFFRDIGLVEDSMKVVNTPLSIKVADGKVVNTEIFSKFGINHDIDTGSAPEDIWDNGGLYTGFPDTAETLEILSTSGLDNSGGSGARRVLITNLLDENYNLMPDVELDLNGTTPVSLGTFSYLRCSRIIVLDAGTNGSNVGDIILRHTTTTSNIFATIRPGDNQTMVACYTVPEGYRLLINRVIVQMSRANGSPGSASITIRQRDFGGVFRATRNFEITNSLSWEYEGNYVSIPAKTDIKFTVESVSDNNTKISAEFDGYLTSNGEI